MSGNVAVQSIAEEEERMRGREERHAKGRKTKVRESRMRRDEQAKIRERYPFETVCQSRMDHITR